jgi:hypothetical protein
MCGSPVPYDDARCLPYSRYLGFAPHDIPVPVNAVQFASVYAADQWVKGGKIIHPTGSIRHPLKPQKPEVRI